ncbi:MAG: hypothetical protein LBC61_03770 [Candidatus Peribacteria bacterium]|jgi:5'(3')-deoxyribonucleotidase|nr:hypothetical protein [Candidatus Peribacteria bacterium]
MDVFVPWYNLKHNTNYRIEDFYDYDLRKVVLNGKKVCETQEEATKLVNEFYETQNFENLEPVYLSKETLPLIKSIYDVTIITSRPESLRKSTETWLNKYFEGLFDDVVLL